MFMSLKGKRALVCGSTDGIGKSTAILMAKRGAEIILMSRNQEKLKIYIFCRQKTAVIRCKFSRDTSFFTP